jgi:pyruvate/2-oxoglutarate/acetoin dehydrogenase E1 component
MKILLVGFAPPVMFFEHKLLNGARSPGGKAATAVGSLTAAFRPAPEDDYTVPFGVADVKREGRDVTVVATGFMVHQALQAALELEKEGIDVEVIDPRTLVPLDKEAIFRSVRKTSRLVIVSEDVLTRGVAAEISALVAEYAIDSLDAPIRRVSVSDTPIPFAPVMERAVVPQLQQITRVIRELF